MRTINKVILMGNLGGDVELRYTDGGRAVGKFSLATRHVKKRDDGTLDERVDWHRVVAFGPLAERCSTYLGKGSGVVVDGRISPHSFEDKEGQRRKIVEVVAHDVLFLPRPQGSEERSAAKPEVRPAAPAASPEAGDVPF